MIGYDTFPGAGAQWRRLHGAVIPFSLPGCWTPPSRNEARHVLRNGGGFLIRWDREFDSVRPTEWWHVIKDDDAGLASLGKKTRYLVRQGQKNFDVRPCLREEIVLNGHAVYESAFDRYLTFERCFDKESFQNAVRNMPGNIEFWGVFDRTDGSLQAFGENVVDANACFYSTMWFTPSSLKLSAGYALVQTMNEHYLGERGFAYVSDGTRSISHQTNVHQFLQDKFGFRKAYALLEVEYSRPVAILVWFTYPFLGMIKRIPALARLSVLLEQERIRRACGAVAGL